MTFRNSGRAASPDVLALVQSLPWYLRARCRYHAHVPTFARSDVTLSRRPPPHIILNAGDKVALRPLHGTRIGRESRRPYTGPFCIGQKLIIR